MLNLIFDLAEFDKFMEEHKAELTEKMVEESIDIDMFDHQQAEIERADLQVGLLHLLLFVLLF